MIELRKFVIENRPFIRMAVLSAVVVATSFRVSAAFAQSVWDQVGNATGLKGVVNSGGEALNNASRFFSDLGSAAEGILKNTANTTQSATGHAVTTFQVAGGGAVAVVRKAGTDTLGVHTKAWSDGAAQAQKSLSDTIEAGNAALRYQSRQLDAHAAALRNANERLVDGKIIDSAWGLSTEPLQAQESNFFKATQESSLINQGASSAAAVYGGPGGAAAYASWQAYRTTGDPDLALRAGIISGIQSQAGGAVVGMPAGTTGELVKKSIVAGAVGGIAVAADGGDDQAIRDGFIRSGGAVLVQGGQDRLEAYSPDAADAVAAAHCISAQGTSCLENTRYVRDAKGHILYDEKGNLRIDTGRFDPEKYKTSWQSTTTPSEAVPALAQIRDVAKLPDTQAIPILNNQWVVSWKFSPVDTATYGAPQVVMTYVGENPPFRYSAVYKRSSASSYAGERLLYICRIKPGPDRTISLRTDKGGCVATYRRQAGPQTIWRSIHNPKSCMAQIPPFVTHLKEKGISCFAVQR